MPDPNEYDNQDDFMAACVPMAMREGKDNEAAVGQCMGMWNNKNVTVMDATKVGARNSRRDAERLQMIHDYAAANGATCKPMKDIDPDALAYFGDTVKALGNGKVGGYLVRHSGADDPDLTADYFDAKTEIHAPDVLPVLYQHGFDEKIGKRVLGKAKTGRDDVGLWIEAQLDMRDEYEKAVYALVEKGKLGWSSGALSHLVEREPAGKSYHIKSWWIGEASLTPTPAEPRNSVVPLKSITPQAADADREEESEVKNIAAQTAKEKTKMELNDIKALLEDNNKSLVATIEEKAEAAATKAVEKALDALPEVKAAMNGSVKVTKDEADQPFETPGKFFQAVKNVAYGHVDPRLIPLRETKATGMSEAQPSQAGFLVPQQTAAGIRDKMFAVGTLLSLFSNRDTVEGNNMTYNLNDETSRANGSRRGGITGYWLNEGGTFTPSKPTFRQLELKLKKVTALCVATDELLSDASALGSWLSREVPDELRFKVEDAIINGDGVGKPWGILPHGALKSATRTDANEIDALDLGRMWAGRYAGVSDYVWLGNQNIFPQMLNLTIGNMPVFIPAGGLSGLPYSTLLGRPYYDVEYLPNLGTLGDLLLVSPSQYQMIEKSGGIVAATSIHVYFTTEEQAFRFSYRVDGAPTWRTTLTGFDGQTYSPFVVLAAST